MKASPRSAVLGDELHLQIRTVFVASVAAHLAEQGLGWQFVAVGDKLGGITRFTSEARPAP